MAVIITAKRYENEINEVREIVNEFSEDMEIDDVLYYATPNGVSAYLTKQTANFGIK